MQTLAEAGGTENEDSCTLTQPIHSHAYTPIRAYTSKSPRRRQKQQRNEGPRDLRGYVGGGGAKSVKLCQNVTRTAARIYWQAFTRRGVGTRPSRAAAVAQGGRHRRGALQTATTTTDVEEDDDAYSR